MVEQSALVRDNMLLIDGQASIPVNSPEWYSWLDRASSFRYESNGLHFSARCERFQRGGRYWRAYRRVDGKLRRSYLGRSVDLSAERLQQAAIRLASENDVESESLAGSRAILNMQARIAQEPLSPRPGVPPLLESKLRPPDLRRITVQRPALFERLQAAFHHRLLLIVAPPGWGKTTLMAQAVQISGEPGLVWLTLDEADNDPLRFWSYVLTGLARIEPALGPAAMAFQTTLQPRMDYIMAQVINTLITSPASSARIMLVLDDYHSIREPGIHATLEMLIEQIPERLHVVISSRSTPPLPLARWRAAGYIHELRAPDLRFGLEDGRQLLSAVLGRTMGAGQVLDLIERTEGWAAGLHLAGLALRAEGEVTLSRATEQWPLARSVGHPFIVDYLTSEILRHQSAVLQTFLLRTSILQKMCAELCAELCAEQLPVQASDIEQAQLALHSLEQANMFVLALDEQQQWFRYHQLFADALRTHLQQHEPDLYNHLHRRAMYWYERKVDQGEIDLIHAAVEHGLTAGLYIETAQLLSKHGEYIFWTQGELHTLIRWLKAISRSILRDYPDLILLEAWAQLACVNLEAVEANLREIVRRDDLRFAADVAALRSFMLRLHGDLAGSIELCYLALARMPEQHSPLRYLTHMHLVSNYIHNGEIYQAVRSLERLIEDTRGWSLPPTLMLIAGPHLLESALLLIRGYPRESKQLIEDTMAGNRASLASSEPQGSNALALSEACYALGELAEAEQWATLAAEQGQRSWNSDILSHAYYLLSRVARARGEHSRTAELFQHMYELIKDYRVPHITRSIDLSAAWEALIDGDSGPVSRELFQRGLHEDDPIPGDRFEEYELMARVALAEKRWESALRLAQRLYDLADSNGYVLRTLSMQRLKALALAGAGRQQEALVILGQVLTQSLETGLIQPFLDEGEPMRALLLAYLRSQSHDLEMQHVIRRLLPRFPPAAIALEDDGAATLTVREREVLRLVQAGRSNRQIAAEMVVTIATVKKHLSSIFAKLGVSKRAELIR